MTVIIFNTASTTALFIYNYNTSYLEYRIQIKCNNMEM